MQRAQRTFTFVARLLPVRESVLRLQQNVNHAHAQTVNEGNSTTDASTQSGFGVERLATAPGAVSVAGRRRTTDTARPHTMT